MSPKREQDREFKDLVKYENGTYYLRYWSNKLQRVVEKSLKTDVRAKALRLRKMHIENVGEEHSKEAVQFKTYRHVVQAFLKDTTWNAKATEVMALNQFNRHLVPYFGDYPPSKIDNNLWLRFCTDRRELEGDVTTHNARIYLMKSLNWAHAKGIVKLKPKFDDMDSERESPGVFVTEEEFQAIRAHLPSDWLDISLIAWNMGFRLGEAKNLSWDRVDLETGEIRLRAIDTKNRKARTPVAPEVVLTMLRARKALTGESPWVFPAPRDPSKPMTTKDKPWQDAKKLAGVACRFHDLRHTWLTKAFKATNRYAEICEYAGLSLTEALKTYVKFTEDDMRAVSQLVLGKFGEAEIKLNNDKILEGK